MAARCAWRFPHPHAILPTAVATRLFSAIRIFLMIAGALLVLVTFTPLVRWTASLLTADWTDSDGDVLVLMLGSGDPGSPSGPMIGASSYLRTVYAIDAWRSGGFRTILVSGRGGAETVKPFLMAYGVPREAILVENRSTTTHESAAFAKPLLAGISGRIVLLTSDFHMYRASRSFAHEGIHVITRPIPDVLKRSRSRELRWECFWTLALELTKIGYYRWHGWI